MMEEQRKRGEGKKEKRRKKGRKGMRGRRKRVKKKRKKKRKIKQKTFLPLPYINKSQFHSSATRPAQSSLISSDNDDPGSKTDRQGRRLKDAIQGQSNAIKCDW